MWNTIRRWVLIIGIVGMITLFKLYLIPDLSLGGQIIYYFSTLCIVYGILAEDEK